MRSPELPIDEATFVGLWLETFLYGVSAVLVCSTLAVLRKSRPSAPINKPILSATLLMFAITTAHIGLNFTRTFHALFSFQDVPGGSNIYIEQNDALYVAANILIGIQVVLGDATNLYRLWMVWNRLWRPMVVPGVLFLASATSDCLSVILLFKTNDVIGSNQGSLRTPVLVFEIISIVQPMVTSALIVLRLWKLEKNVSSYRIDTPSSTSPILRMIIESAAFYAVAMLVVVILGFFNVPGFLIAIQMIAPIVSITFCGLTTRVGVHSFQVQLAAAQEASPRRLEDGVLRAPRPPVGTRTMHVFTSRDSLTVGDEYSMENRGSQNTCVQDQRLGSYSGLSRCS